MSQDVVWVKYVWDLPGQVFEMPLPAGYEVRSGRLGEAEMLAEVSVAAYASNPTWAPMIKSIRQRMTDRVMQTFGDEGSEYFCVVKDDEVVAVSGMAEKHWTRQNFLTGPCVLPEHQRRGLGVCLLAISLDWLQERGLAKGVVFTEENSIADKKVYPHFRFERIVGVEYVDPPKVG